MGYMHDKMWVLILIGIGALVLLEFEVILLMDRVKRRNAMIQNLRDCLTRMVVKHDTNCKLTCYCACCESKHALAITSGARQNKKAKRAQ